MASRAQQQVVKRFGPRIKRIGATFFPNGTSTTAMTVAAGTLVTDGGVANVTRTATAGTYLVTLDDHYLRVINKNCSVQHTTAADLKAQFGDFTMGSGTTPTSFTIRVVAVATPTDITANANSSVSFDIDFSDSTLR